MTFTTTSPAPSLRTSLETVCNSKVSGRKSVSGRSRRTMRVKELRGMRETQNTCASARRGLYVRLTFPRRVHCSCPAIVAKFDPNGLQNNHDAECHGWDMCFRLILMSGANGCVIDDEVIEPLVHRT